MSQEDVLRELRKISKVLTLTNSITIEKELAKLASSKERRQMWVFTDGLRDRIQIAGAVKVTPQAVGQFLKAGVALDLIEYEAGKPPRRRLDYVPAEWLSLVEIPSEEEGTPSA
jgi:hypothetical protein